MNDAPQLQSPSGENNYHLVSANYNKLSDHIRRLTPQGLQCCVFCGGSNCKYENPENWTADSLAIQGIYSHWITDNIIAMARPSTVIIAKKNIIRQFQSLGIKSIFNLQSPREHASCGFPLEDSGFSYDPNVFMENGIYYYNFAWKDYGEATLANLLNMVKVLAFAITEGRVAVHCHAGLGRTGVLIACYLVYSLRANGNDAIRYVRYKRPGSVQTRGQILCVRLFAQHILPQLVTYCVKDKISKDKSSNEFTIKKFLKRQTIMLHGYDERHFKYLPKIVHVICERILKLCGLWTNEFPDSNTSFTKNFLTERLFGIITRHDSIYSINNVILPNTSGDKSPTPSTQEYLSDSHSELSTLEDEITDEMLLENKCFQELETQKCFRKNSRVETHELQDLKALVQALLIDVCDLSEDEKSTVQKIENQVNISQIGLSKIQSEKNLSVLAALLFEWLECLKVPLVRIEYLEQIVINYKQPETCFQKFEIEDAYLLEYMLHFLSKIQPVSDQTQNVLLKRFVAAFAQRGILIGDRIVPSEKDFPKFMNGSLTCTMEFFEEMFRIIDNHHKNNHGVVNSPHESPSATTNHSFDIDDDL